MKEKIMWGRNTFDAIDEDDLPCCMFLGMAVEEAILGMYPWMNRVGELYSDGISMSPDAVARKCKHHLLSPQALVDDVLVEVKCTWKSSKQMLEQHLNYLQQIKGYARALNTRFAILFILHVNGDYSFGSSDAGGPHLYMHHIEFTPWEIESNWKAMLSARSRAGL